jgi:hypothetical protein
MTKENRVITKLWSVIILFVILILFTGCASKQVLVGKKCIVEDKAGYDNSKMITKSYVWFVDKDKNWTKEINKNNCE